MSTNFDGIRLGGGGKLSPMLFKSVINATATIDPASLVDGAGTTETITVTGAAFGDFVLVAAPYDLEGLTVTAYVSAANTVDIRIQNESGETVDLDSGTWKVKVLKDEE